MCRSHTPSNAPKGALHQRLILWIINKLGSLIIKDDEGSGRDALMVINFRSCGNVSSLMLTAYGSAYLEARAAVDRL